MTASKQSALVWLFVALTLPAVATAADEASAHGKWTVAGKTVELVHVRAFREPDPFGRGTIPCVLLSNEPVPDTAVPVSDDGVSKLLDLMRSGTLRALEICFDGAGTKLRDVNDAYTFHPDVSPGRFALQGFHTFVPDPAAKGRIAGKLTGAGDTNDGGRWTDEAAFSVPMPAGK
jgi:hypothetical protein